MLPNWSYPAPLSLAPRLHRPPDRDDRDRGGGGGLAVLVVGGALVVMLLLLGGGGLYMMEQRREAERRHQMEQRREAERRHQMEQLRAVAEFAEATSRRPAAFCSVVKSGTFLSSMAAASSGVSLPPQKTPRQLRI